MTLEYRQRQSMADFNRSAFRHELPGFSRESKRLDAIAAEAERQRQQAEAIRQMNADMASEIERIKSEDWKEPEDLVEFAKAGEFKGSDQ
jgi:hypothetical protein